MALQELLTNFEPAGLLDAQTWVTWGKQSDQKVDTQSQEENGNRFCFFLIPPSHVKKVAHFIPRVSL